MLRRSFLHAALGFGLASSWPRLAGAQQMPLRLGVHPYNSTLALLAAHRPLIAYLEKRLNRRIEFYTAASFEAFVAALMAGEYDIAISPPHFAIVALEKGLYLPVAHYRSRLKPLLVVRNDSPLRKAADFAGKRIAMADKLAFIRIAVLRWLADAGLQAGRDYEIVERPTHGASISAAAMGEVDAGLATTTALKQVPLDVQQQVRIVSTGLEFPHLFTLANPRIGLPVVEKLKQALLELTAEHPDGRLFYEKTAYGGFEEITQQELTALRPYIDATRQLIETTR